MPSFCEYRNCHNLGSSSYQGYCNKEHMTRGLILELNQQVSTLTASLTLQVDCKEAPPSKVPVSELPDKQ